MSAIFCWIGAQTSGGSIGFGVLSIKSLFFKKVPSSGDSRGLAQGAIAVIFAIYAVSQPRRRWLSLGAQEVNCRLKVCCDPDL
jgi:hypothetical protein